MFKHHNIYYLFLEDSAQNPIPEDRNAVIQKNIENFFVLYYNSRRYLCFKSYKYRILKVKRYAKRNSDIRSRQYTVFHMFLYRNFLRHYFCILLQKEIQNSCLEISDHSRCVLLFPQPAQRTDVQHRVQS